MCLPSLRADGSGWLEVKMSSTEGQLFLHEVLGGIEQDSAPVQKLGTHSLKATLLSWAQRSPFVIFKMWERKLMGHHSLDKNKSPLTYSRQAYATLMGKVQAMFESINSGQFNPDLSAAGRGGAGCCFLQGGERQWLGPCSSEGQQRCGCGCRSILFKWER